MANIRQTIIMANRHPVTVAKPENKKLLADSVTKQMNWNTKILPQPAKKALEFLSRQNWLKHSGWYLAGGTALALQVGHRRSVDLDFFTTQANFNSNALLGHFLNTGWQTSINEQNTVHGELFGAKISFIAYPFFIPKQKPIWYGSVRILKTTDLAVMKIIAISQRGRKRDFAESDPMPDIYFKATWKEVKKYFLKEVPIITKEIIKLA